MPNKNKLHHQTDKIYQKLLSCKFSGLQFLLMSILTFFSSRVIVASILWWDTARLGRVAPAKSKPKLHHLYSTQPKKKQTLQYFNNLDVSGHCTYIYIRMCVWLCVCVSLSKEIGSTCYHFNQVILPIRTFRASAVSQWRSRQWSLHRNGGRLSQTGRWHWWLGQSWAISTKASFLRD